MGRLDATTRRAVGGHAAGALALSVPWPLLLVEVARRSDDPFLLGLAGSARMVPFIVCSWAAGRLADRMRRDLLIRLTLAARGALLLLTAVALVTGHVWTAVVAAGVAVAVATPAYPALVAAMPGLARRESRRATDLLVTVEVGAFVVGAAIGGVLLHPATRMLIPWLPVALVALAAALLLPVRIPRPAVPDDPAARISARTALAGAPAARRAIGAMAVVNLAASLVALALVPLALVRWGSDEAGYGVATGALGLSSLAAPLLTRLGSHTVARERGRPRAAGAGSAARRTGTVGRVVAWRHSPSSGRRRSRSRPARPACSRTSCRTRCVPPCSASTTP